MSHTMLSLCIVDVSPVVGYLPLVECVVILVGNLSFNRDAS